MTRRVSLYLVGSLVLVSLAGCGRGFFQTAEREAWRREAEVACLKSGQLKEGTELVRIRPISGPGVCGADFPLKVAALGSSSALGFAGDLRPPGDIPQGQPRWPVRPAPQSYPVQQVYQQQPAPAQPVRPQAGPSGPISLAAPGIEADVEVDEQPRHASAVHDPAYGNGVRQAAPRLAAQGWRGDDRRYDDWPLPRLGPAQPNPVHSIGPVTVKPAATLACPITSLLDRWVVEAVQPAALRWFGSPVAEIRQISAYSCRGMNGNPNARISEHAFGNALDIAGFTLADGRRVTVKGGWKGMPEEQGFLRDVQAAACQYFSTVLAPGSNIYHYDHIHVDLMRRRNGRAICQPGAVSGDLVAARAGGGRPGAFAARDGSITGSIGKRTRASYASEDDDIDHQ
ncbi:MAG TPA: extensin family protein [Xanthobacteraceae bacterium]|nr:extensin family protein [Xanthobacteraceae bacterium]